MNGGIQGLFSAWISIYHMPYRTDFDMKFYHPYFFKSKDLSTRNFKKQAPKNSIMKNHPPPSLQARTQTQLDQDGGGSSPGCVLERILLLFLEVKKIEANFGMEKNIPGWWFQRCFIFTPIWERFPF